MNSDEEWIRNELIPSLVASGKLSFGSAGLPASVRTVELSKISMEESFMLTVCFKAKIVLVELAQAENENAETAIARLVVKITPNVDKAMYDVCNFSQLFHNEVIAYESIIPSLGWINEFPRYYYSHIRDTQSAIVLEDFAEMGFRVCKQTYNLSLEHILTSVIHLGKVHGTMYALKHTNQAVFNQFKEELQEPRFRLDYTSEQWDLRLRLGPKRATKSVRDNSKTKQLIPESFLQSLEALLENTHLYQKHRVTPEEPLAILCHGDYLRNNIAFKYPNEKTNIPDAAMMFDFQTLRYSSPMIDLVTFMANSSGVDVRREHFNEIFSTYYKSLIDRYCQIVKCPKDNLPEYFSHDNFLHEYATYLPFGLSVAASFLGVQHLPESDFATLEQMSEEASTKDAMERGGEGVDRELRALVQEMYELHTHFNIQI